MNIVWRLFEECGNNEALKAALRWSKLAVDKNSEGYILDTYANLLYKLGIAKMLWQEKALSVGSEDRQQRSKAHWTK